MFRNTREVAAFSAAFHGTRLAEIPITPKDLKRARTPSIAVQPFENLSNNDRWGRYGRELTTDIANQLVRLPRPCVTAPHSAELAPSNPQSAARDLKVRLIVSGAIRVAAATLCAVAPNLSQENYEYNREADRPHRKQFNADARVLGIPVTNKDLQLHLAKSTPDN